MKPILSIVVPVYNAEAFVARTIENLLAESVSKEIILVNDGSTDGSLEILQTYASKYSCIRVINQENSGVSSARNVGMDAAIGEYIFFNDCDDIQEIGTLTRAVDYFDIGVDAVIFSYKDVGAGGKILSVKNYLPTGYYPIEKWASDVEGLINSHIVSCTGTTVRKLSILRSYGIRYNESLNIYEDMIFGFEYMCCVNKLYYINEPWYSYVHINSHSLFQGYHNTQAQAVPLLLKTVECFFNKVVHAEYIPYIHKYVQIVYKATVQNEAKNQPFFSFDAKCKLKIIADSPYLEYCNAPDSLLPKMYYYCLSHHHFTLLMFLAGLYPKVVSAGWRIVIPVGRFVKRRILRNNP